MSFFGATILVKESYILKLFFPFPLRGKDEKSVRKSVLTRKQKQVRFKTN